MSEGGSATAEGFYTDRVDGASEDQRVIGRAYFGIARAVRCSALTTPQRAIVVLSLALRANRAGLAWPAIETIAGDVGMSRRGVQYALLELEALGAVVREGVGKTQAWRVDVNRIAVITPADVADVRAAARTDRQVVHGAPPAEKGARRARESARGAPDQPRSAQINPPLGGVRFLTLSSAVSAVWAFYRTLHPKVGERPPRSDLTYIEARLRELRDTLGGLDPAVDDLIQLIDAHHRAPTCAWFQGKNPDSKVYLGIETLLKPKGFSTRRETAAAWAAAGRPTAGGGTVRQAAHGEADKAWSYLASLIRDGKRGVPADLAERVGEAKAAALVAALGAIGGWTAYGRLNGAGERDAREVFVAAFVEARGGAT